VNPAGPPAAVAAETKAFVVTTDYSTGSFSAVNLDTRAVSQDVADAWRDATLRWYNGKVYVVNRAGQDNIQVIDPAASYATVLQFSTGAGSNPQDIAFESPTRAFVSLYDKQALLVCNPETGATLDTISLAPFADADHLPEMAHLALIGDRLFVAVQRLDRLNGYAPTAYSLVVVIDANADTVIDADPVTPGVQGITLTAKNPVTTFSYVPDQHRLLIGCAGRFQQLDGGIEAIDLDTLHSVGFVALESQLGGDIGDIEWYSPTHSYAIVSDVGFNAMLVSFNPSNGAKLGTVRSPGGFSLPDCAINDRGELYVADNGFGTAGIYVYSAGSDVLIAGPLDTGLPPNQIAFDASRDEVAGVPPALPPSRLTFAAPWPNPARGGMTFDLNLPESANARIELFDLAGRRVAVVAEATRPAGAWRVSWSGRGARLEPGIYLARATDGKVSRTRRIAILN
jgi:DNA-binding beta-propeller fold protein YncE